MAKDDRKTVTIADMGRGLLKMAPTFRASSGTPRA